MYSIAEDGGSAGSGLITLSRFSVSRMVTRWREKADEVQVQYRFNPSTAKDGDMLKWHHHLKNN